MEIDFVLARMMLIESYRGVAKLCRGAIFIGDRGAGGIGRRGRSMGLVMYNRETVIRIWKVFIPPPCGGGEIRMDMIWWEQTHVWEYERIGIDR